RVGVAGAEREHFAGADRRRGDGDGWGAAGGAGTQTYTLKCDTSSRSEAASRSSSSAVSAVLRTAALLLSAICAMDSTLRAISALAELCSRSACEMSDTDSTTLPAPALI